LEFNRRLKAVDQYEDLAMSDLEAGGPERRARITADIMAKTGIDEPMIERLVRLFYQRIQAEPVLGPIFAAGISDWELLYRRLCCTRSSVALMSGRYHGQPMRMHMDLPVDGSHLIAGLRFSRARPLRSAHLSLPNTSLNALGIADSLELGIATAQGRIAAPRHSRLQEKKHAAA
jgi:hemoglobin